jgi:succinate dehydrogenase flavin-adding protein (antitoxin of CptAB toxin-antitoxin module)
MRRSYISPEFDYKPVFGTYNMQEISSLFSSKMLEIEDFLEIHDQNLVYFQTQNSEQLDLSIESSLTPISYSASDDKKNNHTLVIDDSQSLTTRDTRTRWIMTINLNNILSHILEKFFIFYYFFRRIISVS